MKSESSRVLVLGGSGFVGKSVRDQLRNRENFSVFYTSTSENAEVTPGPETHLRWTIGDPIDAPPCDYIVHAATPASALLNSDSPREMFNLNLAAMKSVLDLASDWGNTPKILFTSSGAVYGDSHGGSEGIPEHWQGAISTMSARAAYGEGKRAAETLLSIAGEEKICEPLIARLFAFSGTYLPLDRHFALGNFVRDAVQGSNIVVRGDGRSVRSYLDQSDLGNWLVHMMKAGDSGSVYHVGSERPISILQLARLVKSRASNVLGKQVEVHVLNQNSRVDGYIRYVPNTAFTRAHFGLTETVTLETSIDQMLCKASGGPAPKLRSG